MSDAVTISLQILLPEAINRRFARRVAGLEGASWPEWGGHITLVPPFAPKIERSAVLVRVAAVCEQTDPFTLHLAEPTAHPDSTRSGYQAVFLTMPDAEADDYRRLLALRERLLAALEGVREDVRPEISAQPFLPHVTLALSLGEQEAMRLVRDLRADSIQAEFRVKELWALTFPGEGADAKPERTAISLGSPPPLGLLSD